MNPLLLASTGSLAEGLTAKGTISAATGAENGGEFSLPTAALAAAAERLQGAKHNHQQAEKTDASDPTAMQAMLAMLLAQPAHAVAQTGTQNQPGGEMLKMLATTTAGSDSSPLLQQIADVMEKNSKSGSAASPQDSAPLSTLSPKLQGLMASLTQNTSQAQTPDQQAAIAKFSAQDLRAIAPEQPAQSVAQQVADRVKQTNPAISRQPQVKKTESLRATGLTAQSMAQNLVNVTSQGTQPANLISDGPTPATHVATPVDLSPDELGEKLTAMLKDRIQFQLNQQQQTSTIRLDPPSLGKLEIAVQLDSGKLMVHIGANQADVCRTLQQFSDNLRQHLTAQNFMEVNVQVSSEGQSQQQQQSGHQQDEVKSALALNDEPQHQQSESVLIKV
ncbi:flagellar hook-length control protein FliK [Kluyvera ascorbata]|uniref:Flagellar hook-length control protein FliK n=1 Tax=Kluyvera ascorbata TaxID=51288 RepID=A0AB35X640_9ENTR